MDSTAARRGTTSAVQSALEAAQRERDEVVHRLGEVDRLIARLQQAVDDHVGSGAGQRPAKPTGRKQTVTTSSKKTATTSGTKTSAPGPASTSGTTTSSTTVTKQPATKKTAAKKGGTTATTARRGRAPAGEVSRSDRVVQVIAESDQPLTTAAVRSRLQHYEPEASAKVVSASLSYAQRKGRIRRNDNGRWLAAASETGPSQTR